MVSLLIDYTTVLSMSIILIDMGVATVTIILLSLNINTASCVIIITFLYTCMLFVDDIIGHSLYHRLCLPQGLHQWLQGTV